MSQAKGLRAACDVKIVYRKPKGTKDPLQPSLMVMNYLGRVKPTLLHCVYFAPNNFFVPSPCLPCDSKASSCLMQIRTALYFTIK